MDINAIFTLGIPALVVGSIVYQQFIRPFFRQAVISPPQDNATITQETIQQATEETPLAMRAWLDYINEYPHLAIIGPTKAGKTTTATTVLADRPGQIVILTGKDGDTWAGLEYIGIDDDLTYTTVQKTFTELHEEIKRRQLATKHRRLTADWLTIVVDDFSTLVKEAPIAADVVKLVARIGRSLRVRLVMLSDSALVKAIGLEGEGETRGNFVFVRLRRGHKGTIEIDGKEVPIDTSAVHQLSLRANLVNRKWIIPRDMETELSDLLARQVGNNTGNELRYSSNDGNGVVTASESEVTTSLPVTVTTVEAAKIAALLVTLSPSEVIKKLDGYSPRKYNEYKQKVDSVKALLTSELK